MLGFFKKLIGFFKGLFGESKVVTPGYTLEQIEGILKLAGTGSFVSDLELAETKAIDLAKKQENLNADAAGIVTAAEQQYKAAMSVASEARITKLTSAKVISDQAAEVGEQAKQALALLAVFAKH